jgi:hypothetical protein
MAMILFALAAVAMNSWGQLEQDFNLLPNPFALSFSLYLLKYFYTAFVCFFCSAYYFSFGLFISITSFVRSLI